MDSSEARVNSLYKTNATATWAKNQLRILHDMVEDRNTGTFTTSLTMQWLASELERIEKGILITV